MMKSFHSSAAAFAAAFLIVCAFPPSSAFAHGTHSGPATTAVQADQANTMEAMRDFAIHAATHLDEAFKTATSSGYGLFLKETREAPWKSGSTYLILIEPQGGTARNHANYPKLNGVGLDGFPVVKKLHDGARAGLKDQGSGPVVCDRYDRGGTMRWACAVPYTAPSGLRLIFIAGFDHDEKDERIAPRVCPPYETPSTTAEDVAKNPNRETLKMFVQAAEKVLLPAFAKHGQSIFNCFYEEGGPLKSGSVYFFVMSNKTIVLVNGNDPTIVGSSFVDVYDEDFVDISKAILQTATGVGVGGFIQYKWDDPTVDGDEVNEPGKASGTSPKVTYVEGFAGTGVDSYFIAGSGYYPKQDMTGKTDTMKAMDSDTGCAVAGAGGNPVNSAFGLFLAVFSICFVLCTKSRERK